MTPGVDIDRSFEKSEHVAGWHFPSIFLRVLPARTKRALRDLRGRILARYLMRNFSPLKEFEQAFEDAEASALLSIVVPVHDAPAVTRRCLTSLQKYAPNAQVILVDDASHQEETRALLEQFAVHNHWKLIRNGEALGHSKACGAGADLATRDYLCLLNSDTVVTPWCWRPIVQAFEDNPDIGVAGPSTSYGGEQTLPLASSMRLHLDDRQICGYAERLLAQCSGAVLTNVSYVCGFAFFIRKGIWQRLGGFDRNLLDYCNENELCIRVQQAGYRTVWVRQSYIHHFGAASYGVMSGTKLFDARVQAGLSYIKQKHHALDL